MTKTPLKGNHIKQFFKNQHIKRQEDNIRLLENNLLTSRMEKIQCNYCTDIYIYIYRYITIS